MRECWPCVNAQHNCPDPLDPIPGELFDTWWRRVVVEFKRIRTELERYLCP